MSVNFVLASALEYMGFRSAALKWYESDVATDPRARERHFAITQYFRTMPSETSLEGIPYFFKTLSSLDTATSRETILDLQNRYGNLAKRLHDPLFLEKEHSPVKLYFDLLCAMRLFSSPQKMRSYWARLRSLCLRNYTHLDILECCYLNVTEELPKSFKKEMILWKTEAFSPNFPKGPTLKLYIQRMRSWGANWKMLLQPLKRLGDIAEIIETFWWALERSPLEPQNGPIQFLKLLEKPDWDAKRAQVTATRLAD